MRNLPESIIPANAGFIFHRQYYEKYDAGPVHTDRTEIIAWAIEGGDVFPVILSGIVREFSSNATKACVITPSGRVSVPQVGEYDSFANWEREAQEEHAAERAKFKAIAVKQDRARVDPCAEINAAMARAA